MLPPVCVVVLNWNRRDDTLACLDSVLAMSYPAMDVLLVDNASTDGTVEAVRQAFPRVEVRVNPTNLGFAAGVNEGLRVALQGQAGYILLLNNDTLVAPDMLERLVRAAENDPTIGIVSPLIYYPGRTKVWFAGAYRRRFWPGISTPGYGFRDRARHHRWRDIDYATGCAMLLRPQLLREIGLFDPTYFMYHDDLDLCERARRAGWRIVLEPSAQMEHHSAASTGERSPEKWFFLGRYIVPFYRRYYRWPRLSLVLYAGWVCLREVLKGNWKVVRHFLRGVVGGWKEVFRPSPDSGGGAPGSHPG